MNFVEVDAKGLSPKLAIAITKRALMVSCGKPIILILDSSEARDQVVELVHEKKLRCDMSEIDGGFRLEIKK